MNEKDLGLRVQEVKRLLGLKVYEDGFKPVGFFWTVKCGSFREIETNINLMIWLKESFEAPWNCILQCRWKT